MIKFIITIITLPLAAVLLYMMLLNMDIVTFNYSPVHDPYQLPLSVLMLALFGFGFFVGIIITWLQSWRSKSNKNKSANKKEKLDKTFEAQQEKALAKLD